MTQKQPNRFDHEPLRLILAGGLNGEDVWPLFVIIPILGYFAKLFSDELISVRKKEEPERIEDSLVTTGPSDFL